MKKIAELVFIPSPGVSHVVSTVETAKHLLDRDNRLSITILIMELPKDRQSNNSPVDSYIQKISSDLDTARMRFANLPAPEETSPTSPTALFGHIDNQIDNVRDIVTSLLEQPSTPDARVAGLVVDMFCTKFMEVADEFGLPAYVFFTSGACALGTSLHLVKLKFDQGQDLSQYKNSDAELSVGCFANPVPAKVLPAVFVQEGPMSAVFLSYFMRIKRAKGVMINTFYELERFAIEYLSGAKSEFPRIYPVGPILNSSSDKNGQFSDDDDVKKWLDEQPKRSVVFLCFGSMGAFAEPQVKEIALALENSGYRFLWSLRKPGPKGTLVPTQYESFQQVLPEGFLERTEGIGKVIGWAPQVAVLSHPAVGGFVSHCGWNSTLESVWFGVPIATFPLYAEQQLNAFELIKELGIAEAITIDCKKDPRGENPSEIVGAAEIEAAIKRLMAVEEEEGGSGVRQKVKELRDKSRMALMEGGSSYNAQTLFIEDVKKYVSGI